MKITEAKHVRATHRFYPSRVRFVGSIPQGKGTREVAVDVDPDMILRIADALRATDGGRACRQRNEILDPDPYGAIGHAMWHVDNPERPMPCITGAVIDMDALAAGSPFDGGSSADEKEPVTADSGQCACADCGHEQRSMDPCEECRSVRVVLVSVIEDLCGKDWRDAFRDDQGNPVTTSR